MTRYAFGAVVGMAIAAQLCPAQGPGDERLDKAVEAARRDFEAREAARKAEEEKRQADMQAALRREEEERRVQYRRQFTDEQWRVRERLRGRARDFLTGLLLSADKKLGEDAHVAFYPFRPDGGLSVAVRADVLVPDPAAEREELQWRPVPAKVRFVWDEAEGVKEFDIVRLVAAPTTEDEQSNNQTVGQPPRPNETEGDSLLTAEQQQRGKQFIERVFPPRRKK